MPSIINERILLDLQQLFPHVNSCRTNENVTFHIRNRCRGSVCFCLSSFGGVRSSAENRAVLFSRRGEKWLLCAVAFFPSLPSWRPAAVCSLAPLCGRLLAVQPSAFLGPWRVAQRFALAQFTAAAPAVLYNSVSCPVTSFYSSARWLCQKRKFPSNTRRNTVLCLKV